MKSLYSYFWLLILLLTSCSTQESTEGIDRFNLVTRHNVVINQVDLLGSLSVGNGEFAFTVDVTGLQTFPDVYDNGIRLGTQSQWAWHSFPNTGKYQLSDVATSFASCDNTSALYAVQQTEGRAGEATNWLRANPHRLHLGTIGFVMTKDDGSEVAITDIKKVDQQLDLWSGKIESRFEIEGKPVHVVTYAMQEDDGISARIESQLLSSGRLKVTVRFPYPKDCHVCSGYEWGNDDKHQSTLKSTTEYTASIERHVDSTRYFTNLSWTKGQLKQVKPHEFHIAAEAGSDELEVGATFSREIVSTDVFFEDVSRYNIEHWKNFWSTGAAIDFSKCEDPRANELERRVVLSQYLTKIQCSGSMPPQETGLTFNSWYGKFHLEMHWWHATHFALWDRAPLMNRSLQWYKQVLDQAKGTATWQGYKGARWQKMTEPHGKESPSNVGAFIIWQQPHPIYLAELMYRNTPDPLTLDEYSEIVFQTADFMASFLRKKENVYHLCHPLIPAQEIFKAAETDDPAYELQYWKYALTVAQDWRKRMDMPENESWNEIIRQLAPLTVSNDLYMPNATTPAAYTDDQYRRDHPSVLAAFGVLPGDERIDKKIMLNTFENIMNNWQWESTWGWDYPMMAMTAARLGKPERAIDALMMDAQKNTYLVNGHNFQDDRLRLYLPGNGGLLAAVAMMAGGWDGNDDYAPGFPKDGKWEVIAEGFRKMP